MPSNYTVIKDPATTLPRTNNAGGNELSIDISFDAPGIQTDSTATRPVLYYRVDLNRNDVRLAVSINGTDVRTQNYKDLTSTIHEVVQSGLVKPTGNRLTLEAGNNGSIRVPDIVLLYKEQ
jgi:hypothetical protein